MSEPLELLHEDDSVLVVNKPAGLPVQGSTPRDETVERVLRRQLGARAVRAGFPLAAVHRLDRDTSGVLVLARRRRACRRLMEQFARAEVEKEYLALVLRGPSEPTGRVEQPLKGLGRHEGELQEACTEFVRLVRGPEAALVICRPRTGRTHQIRRHMALLGCPLAGDERYGSDRFNVHARTGWGLGRLFLHARALTLAHPDTGAVLRVVAPVPEGLRAVLSHAGCLPPDSGILDGAPVESATDAARR